MTDVRPTTAQRVNNPDQLFQQGYAPADKLRLGSEAEFFVVRGGHVAPPQVCAQLAEQLAQQGFNTALEFDGIIEYAGRPFLTGELSSLTAAGRLAYRQFSTAAKAMGYQLADTSHISTHTLAEAEANVAPRQRALAGLASMQRHAPVECRLLPLMNASVQVSLNVRNDAELLKTAEMAYLLSPFIYAAGANHPPVFNGQDCTRAHPRGRLYDAYGMAGGIAPAFAQAGSATEFAALHVRDLLHTPLFFTYDAQNAPVVPEPGLPRFADLPAAQQTVTHFRLAQSFAYHDAKVCNIHDTRGSVVGKRVEVRAFDAGLENMQIAPIFCALTMRHAPTRHAVRRLLGDFGFSGQPRDYAPLLQQARENAVHHDGRYMDVTFGRLANGQPGRMLSFAARLGGILEHAVAPESRIVREAMAPLLERCESGVSPAQKLATSRAPVAA